jgi:hypothetical protein
MSRGLGSMQQWIDIELICHSEGRTVAEMHRQYLAEEENAATRRTMREPSVTP